MSFFIRLAKMKDLTEIVAIYNSTIASRQVTADLHPITENQRTQWLLTHLQDVQRPLYVIEQQGKVIAWGCFSDYYPRAAYRITAEISIYIAPNKRRQGWGQILLDYMYQQAPILGIHNIVAIIFAHNKPSIRLFQQNGYVQWGWLPQVCDLDGQLADVAILGKKAA